MKLNFLFSILFFLFVTAAVSQEIVHIEKVNLNELNPHSKKLQQDNNQLLIVVIDSSTDFNNVAYIKDLELLHLDIRLDSFPAGLDTKKFSNLRSLNIVSKNLTNVSALKNLDSLRELSIVAPKIRDSGFLKNLPALKEVSIFSDSLNVIPQLNSSRMESLTLSVGSSASLSNLQSFVLLKEITFLKGGLRSVPDYLSRNLEKITLEEQPLLKDVHHLSAYKKLRNLSISNCGLETIAGDFSDLQMENVWLSGCELLTDVNALFSLKKISGELSFMYSDALKAMDVSGKCFDYNTIRIRYCKSFRSFTGYSECTRINTIDLSGNEMQQLPDHLSVIPNLEALEIYETKVGTLDAIKNLSHLKELEFNVSATKIPESFYKNSNIEVLRIYGTLIKDMSGLSRLKKLKKLNISSANELIKVPEMNFLLGMETLNIFGNSKLDMPKTYKNGTPVIFINKNE